MMNGVGAIGAIVPMRAGEQRDLGSEPTEGRAGTKGMHAPEQRRARVTQAAERMQQRGPKEKLTGCCTTSRRAPPLFVQRQAWMATWRRRVWPNA